MDSFWFLSIFMISWFHDFVISVLSKSFSKIRQARLQGGVGVWHPLDHSLSHQMSKVVGKWRHKVPLATWIFLFLRGLSWFHDFLISVFSRSFSKVRFKPPKTWKHNSKFPKIGDTDFSVILRQFHLDPQGEGPIGLLWFSSQFFHSLHNESNSEN